jgi:hypothetical protein
MIKQQKADPAARRQAVLFVVFGTLAGALLLVAFERYRTPLRDWLLSEPEQFASRLRLLFHVTAFFLSAPLFVFAVYLWSLGGKVMRARQFPPPRHRVVRDTSLLQGEAALARGRRIKVLAVCLGTAGAVLWVQFWWLAMALGERAV